DAAHAAGLGLLVYRLVAEISGCHACLLPAWMWLRAAADAARAARLWPPGESVTQAQLGGRAHGRVAVDAGLGQALLIVFPQLVLALAQVVQVFPAEDAAVVAVGKHRLDGVVAYGRHRVD